MDIKKTLRNAGIILGVCGVLALSGCEANGRTKDALKYVSPNGDTKNEFADMNGDIEQGDVYKRLGHTTLATAMGLGRTIKVADAKSKGWADKNKRISNAYASVGNIERRMPIANENMPAVSYANEITNIWYDEAQNLITVDKGQLRAVSSAELAQDGLNDLENLTSREPSMEIIGEYVDTTSYRGNATVKMLQDSINGAKTRIKENIPTHHNANGVSDTVLNEYTNARKLQRIFDGKFVDREPIPEVETTTTTENGFDKNGWKWIHLENGGDVIFMDEQGNRTLRNYDGKQITHEEVLPSISVKEIDPSTTVHNMNATTQFNLSPEEQKWIDAHSHDLTALKMAEYEPHTERFNKVLKFYINELEPQQKVMPMQEILPDELQK